MADYITVDSGTTNTRVSLVREGKVADTLRFPVGARVGIDNKNLLRRSLREGIHKLLDNNGLTEKDITRILAAGMITCEFGLIELPHIPVPAGIRELHESMHEAVFEDISPIPFVFVRGVKTTGDLAHTDMMRGEETELVGISGGAAGVYILPGSHSKIITTDEQGRIEMFRTMLTGEMIAALSRNTILKDAVDLKNTHLQKDALLEGYRFCRDHGINESLFKVRISKNLLRWEPDAVYSFFVGVVLCDEIRCVLAGKPARVVIGGKKHIKEAMELILSQVSEAEVVTVPDEQVDVSSALGMIRIYEYTI